MGDKIQLSVTTMSVTEYAKHTGVSRTAVLARIGRGTLPSNVSAKKNRKNLCN